MIQEGLVKACEGNINRWPDYIHHAFFADKVTTCQVTRFSPFYLLHGIDPVLPLDLLEATYLVSGFSPNMSSSNLLVLRIKQLQKLPDDIDKAAETLHQSRLKSKAAFERRFKHRLWRDEYKTGDLVLVWNSRVEKELDQKTKPQYLGPFEVLQCTQGRSYILKEMDGTVS